MWAEGERKLLIKVEENRLIPKRRGLNGKMGTVDTKICSLHYELVMCLNFCMCAQMNRI